MKLTDAMIRERVNNIFARYNHSLSMETIKTFFIRDLCHKDMITDTKAHANYASRVEKVIRTSKSYIVHIDPYKGVCRV